MNAERYAGAEWMLKKIVRHLQAHDHHLHAEAVRRYGRQELDVDYSESVFPAAAELPSVVDTPTVKERA